MRFSVAVLLVVLSCSVGFSQSFRKLDTADFTFVETLVDEYRLVYEQLDRFDCRIVYEKHTSLKDGTEVDGKV
jgi:hypothetical protein